MVQELTGLVDEPQNLVSYHLGKLRAAGLVSAQRSSADGRDSYYTVDLTRLRDLLTATGAALHPALGQAPSHPARRGRATVRVLFLCTGNSGRSPMAEALLRARSEGTVEAHSAGSHPKPLHREAVRVLRDEYGIDIAGRHPKHLRAYARRRFDRVITLCDRVREICPEFPGAPETIHWSIPDPVGGQRGDDAARYEAFERTAAELDSRIGFLLGAITRPTSPNPAM
jgi:ArsR family transcriptional regulator, arsenate/arsenite/antimonite-responsive transcriptional repressor / arsenate reductase (thioredoxin)